VTRRRAYLSIVASSAAGGGSSLAGSRLRKCYCKWIMDRCSACIAVVKVAAKQRLVRGVRVRAEMGSSRRRWRLSLGPREWAAHGRERPPASALHLHLHLHRLPLHKHCPLLLLK
jgi:hypothetical protein